MAWHTYATVLEQAGARMKVAQELLRHADIQTTMNVYTGAMERDKTEAANRVAHAVLGKVQRRTAFGIEPKRTQIRLGQNP
jgi:site-specific recombinase XerC